MQPGDTTGDTKRGTVLLAPEPQSAHVTIVRNNLPLQYDVRATAWLENEDTTLGQAN
jgi:hypothetical protein